VGNEALEEQPVFKTGKYAPGTHVEVSQGPFAGLQGEVTETDRLNKKVRNSCSRFHFSHFPGNEWVQKGS
jgi:transcription antitermination factor NusG